MTFTENPLKAAIEALAKIAGIPVWINTSALDTEGTTADEPASLNISEVSIEPSFDGHYTHTGHPVP